MRRIYDGIFFTKKAWPSHGQTRFYKFSLPSSKTGAKHLIMAEGTQRRDALEALIDLNLHAHYDLDYLISLLATCDNDIEESKLVLTGLLTTRLDKLLGKLEPCKDMNFTDPQLFAALVAYQGEIYFAEAFLRGFRSPERDFPNGYDFKLLSEQATRHLTILHKDTRVDNGQSDYLELKAIQKGELSPHISTQEKNMNTWSDSPNIQHILPDLQHRGTSFRERQSAGRNRFKAPMSVPVPSVPEIENRLIAPERFFNTGEYKSPYAILDPSNNTASKNTLSKDVPLKDTIPEEATPYKRTIAKANPEPTENIKVETFHKRNFDQFSAPPESENIKATDTVLPSTKSNGVNAKKRLTTPEREKIFQQMREGMDYLERPAKIRKLDECDDASGDLGHEVIPLDHYESYKEQQRVEEIYKVIGSKIPFSKILAALRKNKGNSGRTLEKLCGTYKASYVPKERPLRASQ
ncbi:hypothetical protein B0O99DRAFT_735357 [Bisporella sp. PMI_857]|nr:hypothetical protein B0O99DRAFT_735357 [Bisporella sp. PMI_857]